MGDICPLCKERPRQRKPRAPYCNPCYTAYRREQRHAKARYWYGRPDRPKCTRCKVEPRKVTPRQMCHYCEACEKQRKHRHYTERKMLAMQSLLRKP